MWLRDGISIVIFWKNFMGKYLPGMIWKTIPYAENISVKRLFLLGLIPAKLKKESSLILIISGLLKSIWAKKNWKVLKSKKSLRQWRLWPRAVMMIMEGFQCLSLRLWHGKFGGWMIIQWWRYFITIFICSRKLHSVLATAAWFGTMQR